VLRFTTVSLLRRDVITKLPPRVSRSERKQQHGKGDIEIGGQGHASFKPSSDKKRTLLMSVPIKEATQGPWGGGGEPGRKYYGVCQNLRAKREGPQSKRAFKFPQWDTVWLNMSESKSIS